VSGAATLAAARLTITQPSGIRVEPGQSLPTACGARARQQRWAPVRVDKRVEAVFLAADAVTARRSWLEIADVIVRTGAAGPGSGSRSGSLGEILACHPGCAAAAVGRGPGYAVMTRAGEVVRFVLAGQPGAGALACGALVHCWLVADLPTAALDRARLDVALVQGIWHLRGQLAVGALSFWLSCGPVGPGPSASRWRRTPAASGTPSSS